MTLAWDPWGQLASVTGAPGGNLSFTYDAFGRRVSKTVNGTATFFLYDGDLPIAELNSAGQIGRTYNWGATGLVSDRASGASRFYLYDRSGNTRFLLSSSGLVLGTGAYTAWGTPLHSSTLPPTPFAWNGRFGVYNDTETGLLLMGARYYAPALGRFISRDPIGFDGDINLYGYCGGDPRNSSDPEGLTDDDELSDEDLGVGGGRFRYPYGPKMKRINSLAGKVNAGLKITGEAHPFSGPVAAAYGKEATGTRQLSHAERALAAGGVFPVVKAAKAAAVPARAAQRVHAAYIGATQVSREARWMELATETNSRLPKEVIDHILRHKGKGVKDRFGLELAHRPKQPAAHGYDYRDAVPKLIADHRIEHRYVRVTMKTVVIKLPSKGSSFQRSPSYRLP